jgi:hypothetical protein
MSDWDNVGVTVSVTEGDGNCFPGGLSDKPGYPVPPRGPGKRRKTGPDGWFSGLVATGIMALVVAAFLAYEGIKFYKCWIDTCDMNRRASRYVVKPVCSDPEEVVEFGVFSADGCDAAQDHVDLGHNLGTFQCWWRGHAFYSVLALEHSSFNYALGAGVFSAVIFTIWSYWKHRTERLGIESNERMLLEGQRTTRDFMNVLRDSRKLQRLGSSTVSVPMDEYVPQKGSGAFV